MSLAALIHGGRTRRPSLTSPCKLSRCRVKKSTRWMREICRVRTRLSRSYVKSSMLDSRSNVMEDPSFPCASRDAQGLSHRKGRFVKANEFEIQTPQVEMKAKYQKNGTESP